MPSKIPLLMASDRPIIASVPANGTAAKAIRKSGGGVVVPPESAKALADAVLKLYQNHDLATQLGHQGRKFAIENYAFEQALNSYEQLFTDVIANKHIAALPELSPKESIVDV
jgi:colanic acid biosynthesis glycosyl transferase WcaI